MVKSKKELMADLRKRLKGDGKVDFAGVWGTPEEKQVTKQYVAMTDIQKRLFAGYLKELNKQTTVK